MNIKVMFWLPTKDFKKKEFKSLSVEMLTDLSKDITEDFEYKVNIPDYMFNELKDTESQFKTEYNQSNKGYSGCFSKRSITPKFQKPQYSTSISILQNYINSLTEIILDRYSIETETLKKKIFIKFNYSNNHKRNDNGAYLGENINQTFSFFIGYEVYTDKFNAFLDKKISKKYITKIYYSPVGSTTHKRDTNFKEGNEFISLCNFQQSVESFEKEYSIIDWSQEREDYCLKIKDQFISVNNNLSIFLKDIDSEKIDNMINSNQLFLK